MEYTPQGIIFPVSASILEKIEEYRKVLESFSHPLLDFIEWKKTEDNNVEVLNNTIHTLGDVNLSIGYYIWNIEVCDKKSNCWFSSANYTYNVSNTPPERVTIN